MPNPTPPNNARTLVTLSGETAYCTKDNIVYPGTTTKAAAAVTKATARIADTPAGAGTVSGLTNTANGES